MQMAVELSKKHEIIDNSEMCVYAGLGKVITEFEQHRSII